MNYRFLKLAKLLNISQFIKVAVSEANEKLRGEFSVKFLGESTGKVFSFADQWYQAFHGTQLYRNWENLETLDAVLSYIKENKNLVSRETAQSENKKLEYLNNKYPDLKTQISQLNPQFLSWLNSRFGENPEVKEIHPIGDCLTTLSRYQEKLDSLKAKFNENQDFKNLILQRFGDISISNIQILTIDQMEKIIALSERKKGVSTVIPEGYIPNEYIGKFGEWNLWMPLTREDSVAIPGFDPDTLEPYTTWCTARTYGSNLFYSYSGTGVILFYVIRDDPNPEDDDAYQSIGWIGGEVQYNGNGTETVNRANSGMYEEDHRALFGSAFDAIYEAMENEVEQLGGQHPVAEKIEEAAFGDQEVYQDLIRGVEPDGVRDIDEAVRDKKIELAENPSVPPDDLMKFSKDKDARVRMAVASNESTPPDVLRELSGDEDSGVRGWVAGNPSTPPDILVKLSGDEDVGVRELVAKNPSTPPDTLVKLSGDPDFWVRAWVAENPSTPRDVVEKLLEDPNESVRSYAKETLKKLQQKQASTRERRFNKIARYLRISKLSIDNLEYKIAQWIDPEKAKEELGKVMQPRYEGVHSNRNVTYYDRLIGDQEKQDKRRDIKRYWNETVYSDPEMKNFIENDLVFAHVVGAYRRTKTDDIHGDILLANWIASNPGSLIGSKDEISVFAFTKNEFQEALLDSPLKGSFILVLRGRPTLMTKTDAATEISGSATDEVKKFYEHSGLRKRPLDPGYTESNLILNKNDFEKRSKDYSEVILGNWSIDYIIDNRGQGFENLSYNISEDKVSKSIQKLNDIKNSGQFGTSKLVDLFYELPNPLEPLYAYKINDIFDGLKNIVNAPFQIKRLKDGSLIDDLRYLNLFNLLKEYFTLLKEIASSLDTILPPVPGGTESFNIGLNPMEEKAVKYKLDKNKLEEMKNIIISRLEKISI